MRSGDVGLILENDAREATMHKVTCPSVLLLVTGILVGPPAVPAPAQGTAAKLLPRVYVFTQVAAPGQLAGPDQGARLESVKDLREELRKKSKFLEVTDVAEKAEVTIEVVSRQAPSTTKCVVTVRLRVIGRNYYKREFQGESGTWRDAASLLAEAVQRWVNETYDTPAVSTAA